MLNIYENRRPANMAIVKQKLQLIASQWVTEKTSVPEPQAPRRSRQRPPTTLRQFLTPPQMTSVGTLLCTYRGHQSLVRAVTWSPDGKCIASVSHDEVVQVWQIAHGDKNTFAKDVLSYCGHACWVYAVAWSPDGQFIASACADKVVQVWKVATGDKICSYRGHVARVNALAWSLDGECIASASDDRTVQVWNATTGKISSICQGHNGAVHALVWSPDGQRI